MSLCMRGWGWGWGWYAGRGGRRAWKVEVEDEGFGGGRVLSIS